MTATVTPDLRDFSGFKPSPHQLNAMSFIETQSGHGAMSAVAGSGKTTTIEWIARTSNAMRDRMTAYVVFNKANADEAARRGIPNARTVHSTGLNLVKSYLYRKEIRTTQRYVDSKKYMYIAKDIIGGLWPKYKQEKYIGDWYKLARQCERLAEIVMLTCTDYKNQEAVMNTAGTYNVSFSAESMQVIPRLIDQAVDEAMDGYRIGFTEMVWLPHHLGLKPERKDLADFVLGDECQDWNAAQLSLILKLRNESGRNLFVGDPRQAIYGFAGADFRSWQTILDKTKATVLPLSVCWRCPSSVLALAREIVPEIQDRPNAPAGMVAKVTVEDLLKTVAGDELILCRKTAPLVSLVIQMIERKIPGKIRGADIGRGLADMAMDIAEAMGWDDFEYKCEDYYQKKAAALERQHMPKSHIDQLRDNVSAVEAAYRGFKPQTPDDLAKKIEDLFDDSRNIPITLSTVHRAKGFEKKNVYILEWSSLPLERKGQTEDEKLQEQNIKYVAITRSMENLYLID